MPLKLNYNGNICGTVCAKYMFIKTYVSTCGLIDLTWPVVAEING